MQGIIAVIIVVAALGYIVVILRRKLKAFSPKKACGADCGCGGKSKRTQTVN